MAYALRYREELPPAVVKELDEMVIHYNKLLATSLNPDGSLKLATPSGTGSSSNTTSISDQIEAIEGHWWKKGPWRFDTDSSHEAFIVTPIIPAGTYHNYAPQGIASCIGVEINLSGNITLTGVVAPNRAYRRLVVLRNQSSTYTVTLKHQNTGSAQLNRFALPGNTDIVMSQNQTVWLYYDADNHYWTSFITVSAGSVFQTTTIMTEANITATSNTSTFALTPTPTSSQILWPISWSCEKVISGNGTRAATAGTLQLVLGSNAFLGFTLATDINTDLAVGSRSSTSFQPGTGRNFNNYSVRDPRGLPLACSFSSAVGAFGGTGIITLSVSVIYFVQTIQNPGVTP